MRHDLISVYNLFCATCVQLDRTLPLIYHSRKNVVNSLEQSELLINKMHDLAFDNLHLYKQLLYAEGQRRQEIQLDIVSLLWDNLNEYM